MADIFEEIKAIVPIAELMSTYGVKILRANKAICCFHKEKTPSMMVYPNSNSFYCFGCGVGGSGIDFVSRLFNIVPLEAAKKINQDFNLGLEMDKPIDEGKISEIERDKRLTANFDIWIDKAYITLCDYLHLLEGFKEQYKPKDIKTIDARYTEYCHNYNYIEYLIDILISADLDGKTGFYKTYREEIESIAARREVLHKRGNGDYKKWA